MEAAGADIIDIGAESTRPGATPVGAAEELGACCPVLRGRGRPRARCRCPSTPPRPTVADVALDEGVAIVNDVSGLRVRPAMGPLVAARGGAGRADAHARPAARHVRDADYGDVVAEVMRDLQRRVERARGFGVGWDRLIVDPGLGFAKRPEQSLASLARLEPAGGPRPAAAGRAVAQVVPDRRHGAAAGG